MNLKLSILVSDPVLSFVTIALSIRFYTFLLLLPRKTFPDRWPAPKDLDWDPLGQTQIFASVLPLVALRSEEHTSELQSHSDSRMPSSA